MERLRGFFTIKPTLEEGCYPQSREPVRIDRRKFLILTTAALGELILEACSTKKEESSAVPKVSEIPKRPTEHPPKIEGKPRDYFPAAPGTKWVYKITLGEEEPLRSYTVSWPWPTGEGGLMQSWRGRFLPPPAKDNSGKTFALEFNVEKLASPQGPFEFPEGVKLQIGKDELGIFEGAKDVFWAITQMGTIGGQPVSYDVMEVRIHSTKELGAPFGPSYGANREDPLWKRWGIRGLLDPKDGYSTRHIFFGAQQPTKVWSGGKPADKPTDYLLFEGLDNSQLYFKRFVERFDDSSLGKAFSEEMWFKKGVGLFRLEQKVEGKTSMVWELVQSSSNPPRP